MVVEVAVGLAILVVVVGPAVAFQELGYLSSLSAASIGLREGPAVRKT